ncbi:hypothetical protein PDY_18010 [Photobacterium damselae subsp. damselae]|uniref:hypothetical protein n=1 Tax=Photobacterium damselae TaxID=38293 RepID=UPI00220F6CB9|nr:hypothetical protein [Photobacterium damselae]BDR34753.1 hypothetical protein PDY_18010 [Photobacterium damselae subsp. damselae]
MAKSYFESIDLSYFQRGKFVDLYIAVEQYEEALAELLKNSSMSTSEQDPFHYQKLCKTYRSLDGYIDLSIESIDKAIDLCSESDKNKKYLSAFLHDKALSVYLKSIHDAIPILSEAISLENNPKTKGSWNQKLAKWKSEL